METMKIYQNRQQLSNDVNYIKETITDTNYRDKLINDLFQRWKNNAEDSPWTMNVLERNAVQTLIKISEEGVSSEWCGEHIIFEEIQPSHKYNLRKRK
jgi:hypothetical protein|tara:strand:+ start:390 stop:683 length:294 start_codon:yes stop_codon:yes gene_type:complete